MLDKTKSEKTKSQYSVRQGRFANGFLKRGVKCTPPLSPALGGIGWSGLDDRRPGRSSSVTKSGESRIDDMNDWEHVPFA